MTPMDAGAERCEHCAERLSPEQVAQAHEWARAEVARRQEESERQLESLRESRDFVAAQQTEVREMLSNLTAPSVPPQPHDNQAGKPELTTPTSAKSETCAETAAVDAPTGERPLAADRRVICRHCGARTVVPQAEELVAEASREAARAEEAAERALAELTRRRDAITSQLTSVRTMLASATGATAGQHGHAGEPDQHSHAHQAQSARPGGGKRRSWVTRWLRGK